MDSLQVNRLSELETVIERGQQTFIEVGVALAEIRDSKLYRERFATFEDYCRDRWGWERQRAYQLIAASEAVAEMSNMFDKDWMPPVQNSRQAAELAKIKEPERRVEVWQQANETATENNRPVTAKLIQEVAAPATNGAIKQPHIVQNSGNEEWNTPERYVESARKVLGIIELDPATNEKANETVRAGLYYTKEDDGLQQEWEGTVWMNPPYSNGLISQFVDKLLHNFALGHVPQAVVLVNSATETRWFQGLLKKASAVCLVSGRIRFIDSSGQKDNSPLQGQAFIYLGPNSEEFSNEFLQYGTILHT